MRKFILIAAMVLVSATAQAGAKRGLTMAANAEQSKPVADKDIAAKAGTRKHKRSLTEARVIYELHRHGIYW
jgi:hypothetical protein